MKLIKGTKPIRRRLKKPVVAIGIFDGVHLGHQKIIRQIVRQAKIIKGTSVVLTFSPHPLRLFKGGYSAPLITSLKQRIDLIKRLNTDICLLLDFNQELSQLSAREFVQRILIKQLGVNYLIVGDNFRFGKNKKGSVSLLRRLSRSYGYQVRSVEAMKIGRQVISSSQIRLFIQQGKINIANKFLGRNFSLYGRVSRGLRRGRILGYPTANITPEQELTPLAGVYAVWVRINKQILPGILNIGIRPTFKVTLKAAPTIEVHIFNFAKRLYGRKVEVFFGRRIRAEKKFPSGQALLRQIRKDELKARRILQNTKPIIF